MAISLITRLHFDDMRKFLAILLKLVNAGNSCQADSPPQQPLSLVVREAYSFRIPALHEDVSRFTLQRAGRLWQKDARNRWRKWQILTPENFSPPCWLMKKRHGNDYSPCRFSAITEMASI